MLREHIDLFGVAPDGRLFRSENGNPVQPSTWWQVWQKVRKAALSEEELAGPLMRRPYDLRHSGVTWRLNSGVPATEVAAWAGHSVEVLMRVYARCVTGLEDVWISRMDGACAWRQTIGTGEWDDERGRVLGAESGVRRHPVARAVSACHWAVPSIMPGQRTIADGMRWRPQRGYAQTIVGAACG
jgi:hypothetical protein